MKHFLLSPLAPFFVILLAVLAVFGCTDPNAPPPEQYVSGVVKDQQGKPVAGAFVNMFYSSIVERFSKNSKILPSTVISYNIPHDGILRVHAENYVHNRVRELLAESVAAGYHEIVWDFRTDAGRDLYTDCYWIVATLDDSALSTKKLLAVVYQYDTPDPEPFLRTNGKGRFSIPYSRLPLHETFTINDFANDSTYEVGIGPTDEIFAFTSVYRGYGYFTYTTPHEITIVLSQKH